MDTKAAFEKWFTPKFESMMRNGLGITAIKRRRELYWEAYQASCAAIEIELPEEMQEVVGHDVIHGRVMANDMLHDCTTAITSHGIRIKGKTE